jgi:nicotinic acid mononucleotide adenylyltransferase
MSVGLFGGSFNPAHDGHAHVAETALRRLGLDRVVWLVSPQNPLKDARESAALSERMASAKQAARLAASGPSMIVSDVETRLGTQWTVDTLRGLVAAPSGREFRLADGIGQSGQLPQMARLDRHHAADADGGDRPARLASWTAAPLPRPPGSPTPRVPAGSARLLSNAGRARPGPI